MFIQFRTPSQVQVCITASFVSKFTCSIHPSNSLNQARSKQLDLNDSRVRASDEEIPSTVAIVVRMADLIWAIRTFYTLCAVFLPYSIRSTSRTYHLGWSNRSAVSVTQVNGPLQFVMQLYCESGRCIFQSAFHTQAGLDMAWQRDPVWSI